jgi:DNA-binding protein HU-beta
MKRGTTKTDLIIKISKETKLEAADVKQIIETFYKVVIKSMSKKKDIELRGFGTFYVLKKMEKQARDIRRKISVTVPTHYTPRFRPVKSFVEAVKNSPKVKKRPAK